MPFTQDIADRALVACGRSCCICHRFSGQHMELHHIKPQSKGGDDSFDNCIPLCFDCHADVGNYNAEHPKGRKYTATELRRHRDDWYKQVQALNTAPADTHAPTIHKQVVSGSGNIVAGRDLNVTTEKVIHKTSVQTDPGGKHITNATARKIQKLVNDYIDIAKAAGKHQGKAAQRIWVRLKREFDVTTYKEIRIEDGERAIAWLQGQLAQARPSIRRKDTQKWRETLYKPIWARARQLGLSPDDVHALATERLGRPKPVTSLKKLPQRDLEKFHHILIYEMRKTKQ